MIRLHPLLLVVVATGATFAGAGQFVSVPKMAAPVSALPAAPLALSGVVPALAALLPAASPLSRPTFKPGLIPAPTPAALMSPKGSVPQAALKILPETQDPAPEGIEQAGRAQFDGAALTPSYRHPTFAEQAKIDESLRRGGALSPIARDLIDAFAAKGGQFALDRNVGAAYHGTAFYDKNSRRPTVALTPDTIDNGSWAFILAVIGREMIHFHDFYSVVPASVEQLAVQYAHLAMVFAEATRGDSTSWSTNLDHNHLNQGTYLVWSWYENLLKAVTSQTVGFIDSRFFIWLRDVISKETSSNPDYQYSLYERMTRLYWRPGTALHEKPIPAQVSRLGSREYEAASQRVYGVDGQGDNHSASNLLGYVLNWFSGRGNK
ncbi:MAG: hypothetical protein AAB036_01010 [Elusimicrobiota bacterium]